jgi:DegV family protein with EDD domain
MHYREEFSVHVVPLSINFDTESYLDGIDLTPQEYAKRLRTVDKLPTTAQPTVDQFQSAFRKALDADTDVLCITISSGLSGTVNSARLAAEQIGSDRIRVVDSLAASMQLGWLVIETARAIQGGASLEDAEAVALGNRDRVFFFALLETLDYVYKGGRIGRASHMVGSALGIKPIVGLHEGTVVPLERVRTWKKAKHRMQELAVAKGKLMDVAVMHCDNLEEATKLLQEMKSRYPDANYEIVFTGTTVSTYAGPGAVGIMIRVE